MILNRELALYSVGDSKPKKKHCYVENVRGTETPGSKETGFERYGLESL